MKESDADQIIDRTFRRGDAAFGRRALRDMLVEVVPEPDAWTVVHPQEGRSRAEVYVLAGRAVFRMLASIEASSTDAASECHCDLLPITDHATFHVAAQRRAAPTADQPQTTRSWMFDLGKGERFKLTAEQLAQPSDEPGDPSNFAIALSRRIARRAS